jgi:hypothetical protein
MNPSTGNHEVHRTFKPSAAATRGYLSVVFSQTMTDPPTIKADPDTPDATARITFYPEAMGEWRPFDVVMGVMYQLVAKTRVRAVLISHWQQADATVLLGFYFNRTDGQGMSTIANAMSPKDPDIERRLQEAFYIQ